MKEKTKHQLVIASIIATTFPFFLLVPQPAGWSLQNDSLKPIATYLSSVFGYIGITLLVWELILGTRAISGLFFDNLVSKLKLHGWLGKYGTLLIFAHPLLITYAYNESWLYSFIPRLDDGAYEKAVTYGRFAFLGLIIIWLTSALVRGMISYRPWKYIHYISYPILLFSLLHVPSIGTSFSERGIMFFWYMFVTTSIVALVLRMRHIFGFGKLLYEVIDNKMLTGEVGVIRLRVRGQRLSIRTGQYVYVQMTLYGEEHPFTVLDHDETRGELMIAYKVFSSYSHKMTTLERGELLYIDGPYGDFTRELSPANKRPAVYIAGGIGITPFVKHALNQRNDHMLFYANQTKQTSVFRDVLQASLGNRYIDVFSREPRSVSNTENCEVGHINSKIIAKYIRNPNSYDYFICGPQGMIDSAVEALRYLGVKEKYIHAEEFGF